MQFGNCKECNEYKYLKEDATCVSCLDEDDGDWIVVHAHPNSSDEVYAEGLSRSKAKEIEKESRYLTAFKKAKV